MALVGPDSARFGFGRCLSGEQHWLGNRSPTARGGHESNAEDEASSDFGLDLRADLVCRSSDGGSHVWPDTGSARGVIDLAPKLQEYVHEEFGTIRVHWRDELGYMGVVPFSFEADLFISDSEIDDLTSWMRSVRLDRSISVSAVDSYIGGDLPW